MERVTLDDERTVEAVDGVHLTQLVVGEETSVQHFRIEPGATVPEHSHPHEQVGYLQRGRLVFEIDGETGEVGAGDAYEIPGEEPHAAENRGDEPAVGVDVFSPPRADPDWLE